MENVKEYIEGSDIAHFTIVELVNKYGSQFKWKLDGSDKMLDIGCGPGNVTIHLGQPLLPPNYQFLIGCDYSKTMIDFAKNHFETEKNKFVEYDIEQNIINELREIGPFSNATSFKCINWLNDQRCAFKNIYELLCPGGKFMFTYFSRGLLPTLFEKMSKKPKWRKYYKNVKPGRMHMSSLATECAENFESVGFEIIECKDNLRNLRFTAENFEKLLRSLDPILNNLQVNLQDEYLSEILEMANTITKGKYTDQKDNIWNAEFIETYGIVKKPLK